MSDKNEPRRVPAKKPGQAKTTGAAQPAGQSMKDRLLAQRRAEEAAAGSAPAKAPAAKPAAGRAPAAKAPAAKAPAAKAAAGKAPAARPSAGPSAGKAGGARPARAAGDGEGGGRRRAAAREPKKRSPIPMIATGIVVIGAAAGGYYFMNLPPEETPAPTGTTPVAGATGETDTNPDGDATLADAGGAGEGAPSATTDGAPADGAGAKAAMPAKPEAPTEDEVEKAKAIREALGNLPSAKDPDAWNVLAITKNPNQVNDPNGVDLSVLTPYGKPPGMDDATWTALSDDAKLMFDPNAGAKGNRAEKRLEEAGLNAWPAITNEFIKLNLRNPDDNVLGMKAQRLLDRIRGGGGVDAEKVLAFDWRTPAVSGGELERKDLYYNLVLIVELHDVWRRHLAAPDRYFREKLAKGKVLEEMEKAAAGGGDEGDLGISVDDLDDLSNIGG